MYKAKVIKFPFNKIYKCKGHTILKENGNVMLILDNEERIFIPSRFIIEFDDGWFKMEAENVKKQTGGQVTI